MAENSRRLAVLPARGGSKRIPHKNIRDFCGKPMMAHILDAASTSGLFDVIHVSTEDSKIQEVAADLGHPVHFPRPASLADDFTGIVPVLKYVLERFQQQGEIFDQVTMLMACSPLIEASDLQKAVQLFDQFNGERMILGVAPFSVPVEWAYSLREDGELVPREPGKFAIRSQDLETSYYDAGCFSMFSAERLLSDEPPSDKEFVGHILPKWKAIDIDGLEDWILAEALFKSFRNSP